MIDADARCRNAQESPPALTDAEEVWLSMFKEAGVGIGWRVG